MNQRHALNAFSCSKTDTFLPLVCLNGASARVDHLQPTLWTSGIISFGRTFALCLFYTPTQWRIHLTCWKKIRSLNSSAECGWKGGIEQATHADWALFLEFLRRVRERLSAPLRPQILNLSRQNIFSAPFQPNETAAYFFKLYSLSYNGIYRNSNLEPATTHVT